MELGLERVKSLKDMFDIVAISSYNSHISKSEVQWSTIDVTDTIFAFHMDFGRAQRQMVQ